MPVTICNVPVETRVKTPMGTYYARTVDGRRLAVHLSGDPDGEPVFYLHGTPGSRVGPRPTDQELTHRNVLLISYDRPGYGRSDRRQSRTVADAAPDVEAIADELGVGRFAVLGRSGGGPHALACAAMLPERVTRAAALVSLAPRHAEGLKWFEGGRDVFSSVAHPQWLGARIPGALTEFPPDRAHFGALEMVPNVLSWLSGQTCEVQRVPFS